MPLFSKKFLLRLGMASGLSGYYLGTNCDPFVSMTYEWKIRESTMLSYLLGFSKDNPGIKSPKPTISPHLQALIDEVKQKVQIEPSHLKQINLIPFNVSIPSKTVGKAGSSEAYAVIPDYFNVNSLNDLTAKSLSDLIKNYYRIEAITDEEWLSTEGKALIKSFLLSDNAKKFLIAHQLYSGENSPVLMKSVIVFCNVFFFFLMAEMVIMLTGQTAKSMSPGKFLVVSLIPFTLIWFIWKVYNHYIDTFNYSDIDARVVSKGQLTGYDLEQLVKKIEQTYQKGQQIDDEIASQIAKFDPPMLLGAMEYYSKLISRHLALKEICLKRDKWYQFSNRKFTHEGAFKKKGLTVDFVPNPFKALSQLKKWTSYLS